MTVTGFPSPQPAEPSYHSRYAPLREAERLVEARLAGRSPSLVIVLGGGRNYIGEAIRARLPGAGVVLLQPTDIFDRQSVCPPLTGWSPASADSPVRILERAFAEGKGAGGIAVIEWEPVMSRFPEQAAMLREVVARALEREASDSATRAAWARRWLSNCLVAATSIMHPATIEPGDGAVVLACAGPGLSDALTALRSVRGRVSLWALASAHECLESAGLVPDCILATDPGHWNTLHLRRALRGSVPLAMPPSARAPAAVFLRPAPLVAISTGLPFEDGTLAAARLPHARASASGTASGTALSLAAAASSGPILVLGLDYAARDLREHARPYAFDTMDEAGSGRLDGAFNRVSSRLMERYDRADGAWRSSRAFRLYSTTAEAGGAVPDRCMRVSGSPVPSPLPSAPLDAIHSLPVGAAPAFKPAAVQSDPRERTHALAAFLSALATDAEEEALAAVRSGLPVRPDACLSLWALAGKEAAPLVAMAARGACTTEARDRAVLALRAGLPAFLERLP